MGRETPTGKIFTVERGLPSRKEVSQWEVRLPVKGSLIVRRVITSGKGASKWEESFSVGKERPSGKRAS